MGQIWDKNWPAKNDEGLFLVAGPCSAESQEQLLETAKGLEASGRVSLFRAGVWKPRTRPHSFEGVGIRALPWLVEVRRETGLPVATEVANGKHVEAALGHGIDVLWLGSRTTTSPFAVQEIADSLKGVSIPVMVKNPINADVSLWMGAFERLTDAGVTQLMAVHRGFSTWGAIRYRYNPVWKVPMELKRHFPQLPIICDPSHICGKRDTIPEICQKALDWDMNGLMVEVHCRPDEALSDSQQQVTPKDFCHILESLRFEREGDESKDFESEIDFLRGQLGFVDRELLWILKMRREIVEKISEFNMDEVLREHEEQFDGTHLEKDYIKKIYRAINNKSDRH